MGTTLENGVYLPSEGERNCYAGLKTNWEILDQKVADVTALQQAVAGALHRQIVASLPTTDIDPNTIYMVLSGTSATENVYNEFMYVNNAWELIGTSATDLTNYYTKAEVDGKLLLKANASDLTSHTGDTTIHVTASDKAKWNNNTYVFRYSSTALVASSTNSNALLDNTDNLKVGDKVIDSSGVLFSITAIDTQNSTFTIGTALIDLAQDSDVVHKSGNETVGGSKTFDSNTYIYNSDNTATTPNLYLKSSKIEVSSQGNTSGDQNLTYLDKNNTSYAYVRGAIQSNGSVVKIRAIAKDSSNNSVFNELQILAFTNGNKAIFPTFSNEVDLGGSSFKWKSIFATNYYYGNDNVEFSTKFVTTDTNQTITGNKTFSSNVNVYNSDSATDTANIVLKNSKAERGSTTNIGEQNIFFLDKDNAQIGNIKCEVDSNGYSNLTLQCSDTNDTSSGVQVRKTATGVTFQPTTNSQCYLGQSIRRWYSTYTSKINNLEPSSLSLPDLSNGIDISSYITDLVGSPNFYSPPANGYIVLRSTTANVLGIIENTTGMGSFSRGSNQVLAVNLPVVKNSSISIYAICSSLTHAKFIPCLGNV